MEAQRQGAKGVWAGRGVDGYWMQRGCCWDAGKLSGRCCRIHDASPIPSIFIPCSFLSPKWSAEVEPGSHEDDVQF